MERSRAAIAAIHNDLTGQLSRLNEELQRNPSQDHLESEASVVYHGLTAESVWQALYTLADEIDQLRRERQ
jgi:hypothetical protein